MELSQLRAFVAIAKFGQLTRAAEKLHLSQPALSGQIKALEEALGISLFQRTSSGMTLTAGGRPLLAEAEHILGSIQELKLAAQQLQGRPAGRLSLGTVLDPATLRLGEFLNRAIETHALIDVELHQVFSGAALEGVRDGTLDASFFFGAIDEDAVRGEPLRPLVYRVAVPAEWKLSEPCTDWNAIAARPWILAPPTSSHRQLAMKLFQMHGVAPLQVIQADNESVILNLVASGVGASIVREELALASAQEGRITVWSGAELRTWLWFIFGAQREEDPLLEAVRALLRDVWRPEEPTVFRSVLVPPYVRQAKAVDAALPSLYLHGVSTGDMREALAALVGPEAKGLSAPVVAPHKQRSAQEYKAWRRKPLGKERWVYVWADGIYSGLRAEDQRLCALVLVGVNERGQKRFLAIEDGVRESKQSWLELLRDLKEHGLKLAPNLAVGDGALGFWAALEEIFPATRHQRCWVHKSANVLNYLPKSVRARAKVGLHDIWVAETKANAETAFDRFVTNYAAKYPKATECLAKDREALLAFYEFPAEHWIHIRSSNVIESSFATILHRTDRTKGYLTRDGMLAMIYKLGQSAERSWRRLRGFEWLAKVVEGVKFSDGIEVKMETRIRPKNQPSRVAASSARVHPDLTISPGDVAAARARQLLHAHARLRGR